MAAPERRSGDSHSTSALPGPSLRELVLNAFGDAYSRKATGWQVMRYAVLKNRLIQATSKHYIDEAFGPRLLDELRALRDLITLSGSGVEITAELSPAAIALVAEARESDHRHLNPPPSPPNVPRVRSDLWLAVLDLSSGAEYALGDDGIARPATDDEEGRHKKRLPKLSLEDLKDLRRTFLLGIAVREGPDMSTNAQWIETGRATFLDKQLRQAWRHYLANEVSEVLKRWFVENGLEYPEPGPRTSTVSSETSEARAVRDLRELVIRCVRLMTASELESLLLPAGAVRRATLSEER